MLAYARNYALMAFMVSLALLPFWGKTCFGKGLSWGFCCFFGMIYTVLVLHFHSLIGCVFPVTVRRVGFFFQKIKF